MERHRGGSTSFRAFVESNLSTRMVVALHTSQSKEEIQDAIERAHSELFPDHGSVSVTKIMVFHRDFWWQVHGDVAAHLTVDENTYTAELRVQIQPAGKRPVQRVSSIPAQNTTTSRSPDDQEEQELRCSARGLGLESFERTSEHHKMQDEGATLQKTQQDVGRVREEPVLDHAPKVASAGTLKQGASGQALGLVSLQKYQSLADDMLPPQEKGIEHKHDTILARNFQQQAPDEATFSKDTEMLEQECDKPTENVRQAPNEPGTLKQTQKEAETSNQTLEQTAERVETVEHAAMETSETSEQAGKEEAETSAQKDEANKGGKQPGKEAGILEKANTPEQAAETSQPEALEEQEQEQERNQEQRKKADEKIETSETSASSDESLEQTLEHNQIRTGKGSALQDEIPRGDITDHELSRKRKAPDTALSDQETVKRAKEAAVSGKGPVEPDHGRQTQSTSSFTASGGKLDTMVSDLVGQHFQEPESSTEATSESSGRDHGHALSEGECESGPQIEDTNVEAAALSRERGSHEDVSKNQEDHPEIMKMDSSTSSGSSTEEGGEKSENDGGVPMDNNDFKRDDRVEKEKSEEEEGSSDSESDDSTVSEKWKRTTSTTPRFTRSSKIDPSLMHFVNDKNGLNELLSTPEARKFLKSSSQEKQPAQDKAAKELELLKKPALSQKTPVKGKSVVPNSSSEPQPIAALVPCTSRQATQKDSRIETSKKGNESSQNDGEEDDPEFALRTPATKKTKKSAPAVKNRASGSAKRRPLPDEPGTCPCGKTYPRKTSAYYAHKKICQQRS